MSDGVHYEIFFKKHAKASWSLVEAMKDREKAIGMAQKLLKQNAQASVRVNKERFNEEHRTYRTIPIFEEGAEKMGDVKEKTGSADLPCMAPDDLAKPLARDAIHRALTHWLERREVTVLELLHRPDLAEALEGTDTDLQHAVQKVAIASAKDSEASVHAYVKQLNELIKQAVTRLYQDDRAKRLPKPGGKAKLAEIVEAAGASTGYRLRAALAARLRKAGAYGKKLDVLVELAEENLADESADLAAKEEIDSFLAGVLGLPAGIKALLGETRDLGETIDRLVSLYEGDPAELMSAPVAASAMADRLKQGELGQCRTVICRTLLAELEKPKRLRPACIHKELEFSRLLAQKLVMTASPDLPADVLIKIFTERSARLLQPETIDELQHKSGDIDGQVTALISLTDNLVGDQNRVKLAGYIRSLLGSHGAESHFVRGAGPALARLSALAGHQRKVQASEFEAEDKADLARLFDALGLKLIDESKILNAIEGGAQPVLDRAAGLMRLATAGAMPQGDCTADAQARALRLLRSPQGAQEAQAPDAKSKLMDIQTMLASLSQQQPAA
jgi:hypothetical protein